MRLIKLTRAEHTRKHILIAVLLPLIFLAACHASTAIMGTPIREFKAQTALAAPTRRAQRLAQREDLATLSNIKSNSVFKGSDGLAEYRIGPLDVLEIRAHSGSEVITTPITVDNRGRISYSFIDDLDVAGYTPSELDQRLTLELSQYIAQPRIDILVKDCLSKKALIMGELASIRSGALSGARATGEIFLKGKTTLMDLIAQAGGYTVNADIKNVRFMTRGKTYYINLYDIIEKGAEDQNPVIDDGDVIDIPELPEYGERIYVLGEVKNQGIYPLKNARDLLAAISMAGSFTQIAKEENTLIVRAYESGQTPQILMADLKSLLRKADLTQNIALEDGDLIYVPRMVIGDINEWIANTIPMLDFLLYRQPLENSYGTGR